MREINRVEWIPGLVDQPHVGDGRRPARLVHQPPARVGRADPRLRVRDVRRDRRDARDVRGGRGALRDRGCRRVVHQGAERVPAGGHRLPALRRHRAQARDRHPRRVVRVRRARTRACSRRVPELQPTGRRCTSRAATSTAAGSSRSLLTSVGAYDAAPFDAVLTHGFIVDGDGRKMSKSLGNVISPLDVIAKSGADIVRLWVASADYGQDVSVSDEILDRTSEAYRRIRNTFRFLLSQPLRLRPVGRRASPGPTCPNSTASRWSSSPTCSPTSRRPTTSGVSTRSTARSTTTSATCPAVYLDVLKDRLYADAPASAVAPKRADGARRRSSVCWFACWRPILSFTCEEVWQFMPESLRDAESVHLSDWPAVDVPAEEAADLRVGLRDGARRCARSSPRRSKRRATPR